MPTMIDWAERYHQLGWSVLPIQYRSKSVTRKGWQKERWLPTDFPRLFGKGAVNIGVLLGDPSGGLVDVDLDHQLAVELAPHFLPPTNLRFGRPGKPLSHWLYHCSSSISPKIYRLQRRTVILEVRSSGQQTVFPPSTHESGEAISWENDLGLPQEVTTETLLVAAQSLFEAVGERLGCSTRGAKKRVSFNPNGQGREIADGLNEENRQECQKALHNVNLVDHKDGSYRLFVYCCIAIEYDLDEQATIEVIRNQERVQAFPHSWTDDDIRKRFQDAAKRTERGKAVRKDANGQRMIGSRDLTTGKLILNPRQTLPSVQAFLKEFYDHPDAYRLASFAGEMLTWRNNCYEPIADDELRKQLLPWLDSCLRFRPNQRGQNFDLIRFDANPFTVRAVLDSLRPEVLLPENATLPYWRDTGPARPIPAEIIACRSSLLHLPTQRLLPSTPLFVTRNALDYDPDFSAPSPKAWFDFLKQLFGDDHQSVELLQEWFGYCLTNDTSQQKMLLIVGPRRSGKGTLGRVLTNLIGVTNVCGPTISSLATTFGLQPLLGKSLAIVSDARFTGESVKAVVERLLCISGEDAITVDRKYLGSVTLRLPIRFMFLSNELPIFRETSGALSGRFLILQLSQSYYGQEDPGLTGRLLQEKAGILNWTLQGWRRLRSRGHFVMPDSAKLSVEDLEDLSSPVGQYVKERCQFDPAKTVYIDALFKDHLNWLEQRGAQKKPSCQAFGRDLRTVIPALKRRRDGENRGFYDGIGLKP